MGILYAHPQGIGSIVFSQFTSSSEVSSTSQLSPSKSSFCRGQFGIPRPFQLLPIHGRRSRAAKPVCVLPLTEENVELVLDQVRPSLMADGGNVALHEIDGLVVVLKLQGACGSCPSSTMTLKMGIETRLRDKIPEILEVEQIMDTETGLELNEENVEKRITRHTLIVPAIFLRTLCMTSSANCQFEMLDPPLCSPRNGDSNIIDMSQGHVAIYSWKVLAEIRPYLGGTGGGLLELVQINDYVVKVRLSGPAAGVMTVRVALTQKLREKIPSIAAVQLID